MGNVLDWTSNHVINTLLILVAIWYVILIARAEMERRRFLFWLSNPNNEWRQMLYAAAKIEMLHDPTICTCQCVDHGYASGGMHFVACCEPCPDCGARIGQGTVLSPNGFTLPGYRHAEHHAIAHSGPSPTASAGGGNGGSV